MTGSPKPTALSRATSRVTHCLAAADLLSSAALRRSGRWQMLQHQSPRESMRASAGAKGTCPTPAVGMRQTEQQPPKDPRIPKQLDPVAHNEKAYPDDSDSRSFSSELAHALMSEQRCLFCWRVGHHVERCRKLERVCKQDPAKMARIKTAVASLRRGPRKYAFPPDPGVDLLMVVNEQLDRAESHQAVHGACDELKEESIAVRSGELEEPPEVPAVKTADVENMCKSAAPVQPMYNSVYNSAVEMQPMYHKAIGNNDALKILSAAEFAKLQDSTGTFSRVGFCDPQGQAAHGVRDWCSLPGKPFECTDQRGHHLLLMPPQEQLMTALLHYAACKFKDPEHTSACIIVPALRRAQYRHMLERFKKIHTYPCGSPILMRAGVPVKIPRTLSVYYDPPVKALCMSLCAVLSQFKEGSGHSMLFKARVASRQVNMLLDTGATYSFVDEGFLKSVAQLLHTVTPGAPFTMQTAGSRSMAINRQCNVAISLAPLTVNARCFVTSLPDVIHIILGEVFLVSMKADLNLETKTGTLKRGTHTYWLSSQQRDPRKEKFVQFLATATPPPAPDPGNEVPDRSRADSRGVCRCLSRRPASDTAA